MPQRRYRETGILYRNPTHINDIAPPLQRPPRDMVVKTGVCDPRRQIKEEIRNLDETIAMIKAELEEGLPESCIPHMKTMLSQLTQGRKNLVEIQEQWLRKAH